MNEEFDNILNLTDEEGNEFEYEVIDAIEYNGEEFAVLLPVEDVIDAEVIILAVEVDEEGMENFLSVDDVETLEAVYKIFKEKNKDAFNFVD
ncbi:MAG: DUF1292 domain-containing protein [Lachnospiraceae bacterium]|nr:DUF1292 domain-containing protein [Lachnospiraceae bacterium]